MKESRLSLGQLQHILMLLWFTKRPQADYSLWFEQRRIPSFAFISARSLSIAPVKGPSRKDSLQQEGRVHDPEQGRSYDPLC